MSQPNIAREVLTDPSWWHWTLTIPLLALRLGGVSWSIWPAVGLCVVMCGYYLVRVRRLQPYPVQIRVGYLGLLLAGTLPAMEWIHWVQLFGTTAMVTVGYCPLARMLNLLPFNRTEPLTLAFVFRTFFHDPCAGGMLSWSSGPAPAAACCSLAGRSLTAACALPDTPFPMPESLPAEAH